MRSVVPELEQQCACLDALAVLDRQVRDLAAERRRQAGAAAGVDGAGARVRDRRGDGAALGGDERHRDGLRPRDEPAPRRATTTTSAAMMAMRFIATLEWSNRAAGSLTDRAAGSDYQVRTAPVSMWTKFDSA